MLVLGVSSNIVYVHAEKVLKHKPVICTCSLSSLNNSEENMLLHGVSWVSDVWWWRWLEWPVCFLSPVLGVPFCKGIPVLFWVEVKLSIQALWLKGAILHLKGDDGQTEYCDGGGEGTIKCGVTFCAYPQLTQRAMMIAPYLCSWRHWNDKLHTALQTSTFLHKMMITSAPTTDNSAPLPLHTTFMHK